MHLNAGYEYRETLGPEAAAQTLLAYLSRRYRHSSPAEWSSRIAAGHVLIDSKIAHADTVLRKGHTLVWKRPPWREPDAPLSFEVLYEDADILAVAKPAGLPTLPGANYLQSTLLAQVQQTYPDAAPLHRLGRWTSGIVLCARNPQARRALVRQWATQVRKRYRALAVGAPAWDHATITEPIGPVPHPLLGSVHAVRSDGKAAVSHVTVLERRADCCLCDVWIDTGRAHQIRIHLAAAGHPLAGDPLYPPGGRPSVDTRALPGDPGYLLHATELRFRHPRHDTEQSVECEPPSLLRRRVQVTADGMDDQTLAIPR